MAFTLVSGGAGFIGLNLVERLLSDGADVLLLDAKPLPDRAARDFARLPGRLVIRLCDIADAKSVDDAVREPLDSILHAAAITSGAVREIEEAERIVAVNIGGTVNIARLAARRAVRHVGFIGTAAVYGAPSPTSPELLTEDTPPAPDTLYGVTKYSAELVMRRMAALCDFDLMICRLGWVFGPWEHASGVRDTLSPIYQLTTAMMRGRSVNIPRADQRVWTYGRDVARVVTRLLRAERLSHDLYNIASGTEIGLIECGQRLVTELPGADCRVGDASADVTVELFAEPGGPRFASSRLASALDASWLDPQSAFREYYDWLSADPWPVAVEGDRL